MNNSRRRRIRRQRINNMMNITNNNSSNIITMMMMAFLCVVFFFYYYSTTFFFLFYYFFYYYYLFCVKNMYVWRSTCTHSKDIQPAAVAAVAWHERSSQARFLATQADKNLACLTRDEQVIANCHYFREISWNTRSAGFHSSTS